MCYLLRECQIDNDPHVANNCHQLLETDAYDGFAEIDNFNNGETSSNFDRIDNSDRATSNPASLDVFITLTKAKRDGMPQNDIQRYIRHIDIVKWQRKRLTHEHLVAKRVQRRSFICHSLFKRALQPHRFSDSLDFLPNDELKSQILRICRCRESNRNVFECTRLHPQSSNNPRCRRPHDSAYNHKPLTLSASINLSPEKVRTYALSIVTGRLWLTYRDGSLLSMSAGPTWLNQ